jgi:hypothetical protein
MRDENSEQRKMLAGTRRQAQEYIYAMLMMAVDVQL